MIEHVGDVTGVVLAGGEGKRFRPYTDIIPKPMVPVGPEEKPLLEHIIKWFVRYGVKEIVLLVGYRWKQVANYFLDGSRWGAKLFFSLDTEKFRGTGGALLNAYLRKLIPGDTLLVWYGDILAPLDINALLSVHRSSGADVTLVLADRYQVPVGIAEVDREGYVVDLKEKPWLPLKVTIGILAMKKSVLSDLADSLGTSFDIMGDLIPFLIKRGKKVKAFTYSGPWYDVGSMEKYAKLNHDELSEFLR
ncbi:MAG: nucleotidyltransferase family protein [Desulfurococcales archaeon]|nr:nucleotidyltransferase family protein [Desulfurococcales archaeon]